MMMNSEARKRFERLAQMVDDAMTVPPTVRPYPDSLALDVLTVKLADDRFATFDDVWNVCGRVI